MRCSSSSANMFSRSSLSWERGGEGGGTLVVLMQRRLQSSFARRSSQLMRLPLWAREMPYLCEIRLESVRVVGVEGLGLVSVRGTRSRIANVTQAIITTQLGKIILVEDSRFIKRQNRQLRNQTVILDRNNLFSVTRRDSASIYKSDSARKMDLGHDVVTSSKRC